MMIPLSDAENHRMISFEDIQRMADMRRLEAVRQEDDPPLQRIEEDDPSELSSSPSENEGHGQSKAPKCLSWSAVSEFGIVIFTGLAALAILTTIFVRSIHAFKKNAERVGVPPPVLIDNDTIIDDSNSSFSFVRDAAYFNLLQEALGIEPEEDSLQYQALDWLAYKDRNLYYNTSVTDDSRLPQRYALTVFHFATGRWDLGGGWATPSGSHAHECDWRGVLCDERYQVVEGLELSPKNGFLQGTIPTEISMLSSLGMYDSTFNLHWCRKERSLTLRVTERFFVVNSGLTGQLPSSLFELSNLCKCSLWWSCCLIVLACTCSRFLCLADGIRLAYANLSSTISTLIGKLTNLGKWTKALLSTRFF
jgi:hypothetical protein